MTDWQPGKTRRGSQRRSGARASQAMVAWWPFVSQLRNSGAWDAAEARAIRHSSNPSSAAHDLIRDCGELMGGC